MGLCFPVENRCFYESKLFKGALAVDYASIASVGLTGLEPVTLRLSSACSNQLSYRPVC